MVEVEPTRIVPCAHVGDPQFLNGNGNGVLGKGSWGCRREPQTTSLFFLLVRVCIQVTPEAGLKGPPNLLLLVVRVCVRVLSRLQVFL